MRQQGGLNLVVYARSLGLLVRNPALIAGPLVMAIAGVLLNQVLGEPNGGALGMLSNGIGSLIDFLLLSFGFGVSLIIAEQAWRRGKTSFDAAWDEARRKAGDILIAALGFNFIIYVAGYAGTLIGGGIIGLLLPAIAFYFLIYTIPAAAIGGIPGGAALQVSIERVRASFLPTAIMCIVFLALLLYGGSYLGLLLGSLIFPAGLASATIIIALVNALVQAIVLGYIALVISNLYDQVSFGRRW